MDDDHDVQFCHKYFYGKTNRLADIFLTFHLQ